MSEFVSTAVLYFFVAFGVLVGGASVGGLGALLVNLPPLHTMLSLAEKLKIWALVAAVGGTFDVIKHIESGVTDGNLSSVLIKQVLLLSSAFAGAYCGTLLLHWIAKGEGL
ncbi:MAG: YtrH family sporulation protein [Calditerricola sp.]|jgi:hypothetical protein|nr:sporulation protein [Bacillota bacterium]MCG0314860.1 YtrH family sporulation protein [Calditerricola sp.]